MEEGKLKIKLIITLAFFEIFTINCAAAQDCDYLRNQIEYYEKLRRNSKNESQLDYIRKTISNYEKKLVACKRPRAKENSIQIASNNTYKPSTAERYYSSINDYELQQLVKRCNSRTEINIKSPSWDNKNLMDVACKAASNRENALRNPEPKTPVNVRKIKDCIKPNNVIDNEVKECMSGDIEPTWKK